MYVLPTFICIVAITPWFYWANKFNSTGQLNSTSPQLAVRCGLLEGASLRSRVELN